ncbi:MAG: hypothetical protein BGP10_15840 [Rhodanobacter sp. 68-29]|nr:hypothetical protein [Rhodanobacter sp.]ODV27868.1 MAG: hypothetical protein ABT19_01410 [Rhodanobacter sp. SCN 68-63]OJY61377.1 MAG: hypothetical protein BGP10_15840 [Rhodanobacter sp. 68-29]
MNIPRNTPEQLHRRAQLATLAAASAVNAKSHIEKAVLNAEHGRLDLAVLNDLRECIRTIDRAVRHAELCRQRLLRKADRATHNLPNED